MGELYLVGGGLSDVRDLTLRALEVLASVELVLVDTYTSVYDVSEGDLKRLLNGFGGDPEVRMCSRRDLEERFFDLCEGYDRVALLSPGDPMAATTHVALVVEAADRGWDVEIINGVSVFTAAPSKSGLEMYRFGRTATIPLNVRSVYPYDVLESNRQAGLHTLFLLEVAEDGEFVSVADAARYLLEIEREEGRGVLDPSDLAIAVVRLGFEDELVAWGTLEELSDWEPGEPPQALILPASRLREAEREYIRRVLPHIRDVRGV
ncbi:diphthine synthase [Methanopyrus kandleri]|uniref:Diphthine synthase n=2 Tax=Methanopyrus kandleri TaxID=2320 RepID=DPHB_METKA|nr:diphthine synthase [Methanopyrus kandleri]Q8TXC7.1 RecName: Full=Diphthine synthase; AltName: Full=Diphthamide biosynthesis methyltransferase [Methanopyrus kandleri AV19]AAM01961.1 Methyltransferase involved in diphthamide biosynthesis [Methanopyrus kandleri AV19]HII70026.1 diphthine synthase [Methanopyrus kandleri]